MEVPQLWSRIDAEVFDEPGPGALQRSQCLALAVRTEQRQHEEAPGALAPRVLGDEVLELGDGRGVVAQVDLGGPPVLSRAHPELVQALSLRPDRRWSPRTLRRPGRATGPAPPAGVPLPRPDVRRRVRRAPPGPAARSGWRPPRDRPQPTGIPPPPSRRSSAPRGARARARCEAGGHRSAPPFPAHGEDRSPHSEPASSSTVTTWPGRGDQVGEEDALLAAHHVHGPARSPHCQGPSTLKRMARW